MAIKINGATVIADNQAFTTTSTISAAGNVTAGNVSVTGTITAAGINTGSSPISTTGNVTGGNILTGGIVSATGNITGSFLLGNGSQLTGIDATSIQNGTSNVRVVSSGGNVQINADADTWTFDTTGNIIFPTGGIIRSTLNSGLQGVALATDVANGEVSLNYDNTNFVYARDTGVFLQTTGNHVVHLDTAGQLSVGVATTVNLSATGTVTGGNIATGGTVSATGNITGGNLLINGGAVITGNLSVQGTETIFNVANLTVNDLDIIVANNVTGGANVNGAGLQAGNPATATWFFHNATTSWQSNISITPTSNGVANLGGASNFFGTGFLTTASVTGNVQGGNIRTAGLVSASGTVTGSSFSGAGTGLTGTAASLSVGSATTAGTVTTAAQPNITSVGTMSTATITTLSTSAITKTGSDSVGNIGQTDNRFNTVFATATSALYADLAEKYSADATYAPGTVVSFGGSQEVTLSTISGDARIAGVVSTNPSYRMNDGLQSEFTAMVALTGRVPTSVTGTVRKGDLMVSAGNGVAMASSAPTIGTVIGKALEDHDGESGTIEVVVGRF